METVLISCESREKRPFPPMWLLCWDLQEKARLRIYRVSLFVTSVSRDAVVSLSQLEAVMMPLPRVGCLFVRLCPILNDIQPTVLPKWSAHLPNVKLLF